MNFPIKKHLKTDLILSLILRIGLTLALLFILSGGALYFWQHGEEKVNYAIFTPEPANFATIRTLFHESPSPHHPLAMIQMGILMLIATPVVRVISCAILFAIQRDFFYMSLSIFVSGILLLSFF